MEPCYIKQEPEMDTCNNFKPSDEFDFNPKTIKSEEDSNYGLFIKPMEYNLYTDNYYERHLLIDNFLNSMVKHEPEPEPAVKDEESEDEDFELRLSDTSAEDEDEARNKPIPDLRAVTNQLKDAKINETPIDLNSQREKPPSSVDPINESTPDLSTVTNKLKDATINETRINSSVKVPSKVDKAMAKETPKHKKPMKQTSLLSFLNLNSTQSVGQKKTLRSRNSTKVKPATSIIDPVEMKKIMSVRVVLDKLQDMVVRTPRINLQGLNTLGTSKFIHRHCSKCNKDYPDLGVTSNSRCANCSEAIAFRCGLCNKIYRSRSGVRYHLESQCLVSTMFNCSQCEFVSTEKELLRKHENSVHKGNVNGLIKTNNIVANKGLSATPEAGSVGSEPLGGESFVQSYCTICKNSIATSKYAKKCSKCKMTLRFQCARCHLIFAIKKEAQSYAKSHVKTTPRDPQNLKKHKKASFVK